MMAGPGGIVKIDKMPSPTGSPAAKRSLPPVREPAIWRMLNTIP